MNLEPIKDFIEEIEELTSLTEAKEVIDTLVSAIDSLEELSEQIEVTYTRTIDGYERLSVLNNPNDIPKEEIEKILNDVIYLSLYLLLLIERYSVFSLETTTELLN